MVFDIVLLFLDYLDRDFGCYVISYFYDESLVF